MKLVKERAEGSKVLEIGCGPNINTPHWVDIAAECHGIDISDVAISQARNGWETIQQYSPERDECGINGV